jgi:hypothetical protein
MRGYFDELVLLELYRSAKNDGERLLVLDTLKQGVPICAEWILREFERFRGDGPSSGVVAKLDEVTVHVTQYIDNPALRGFPPTTVVNLD